jgi:lysophospholipase L1-like esterase
MPDRQRTTRFTLRALGTLALVALVLLGGTPGRAAPSAAPARQGIGEMYLALGDSLGVGLLSSMPDARGYVAILHGLLEQQAGHAITLRNLSVSGETAHSLIAGGQIQAAREAITEARGNGWRVSPITIDIGGNDLRALQGADDKAREAGLATFRTDIAWIFDALIAATTQNGVRTSDIVTMTVYNPYGGDPQVVRSDAWWVARFNAAIAEEAGKRDIAVADVYGRFLGKEKDLTWVPLDFHANNRGHIVMAEEFWKAAGYDTTAPKLEIVAPAAGQVARTVPTIKVRTSDDIGVTRVELRLDDKPLPDPVFASSLGLWIGYWDARAAPPGQHRLTVSVADAAGNITRQDMTLTR